MTQEADTAFAALVAAAKAYADHLNQWDKFQFATAFGPVYVTIGRSDPYPETFEVVP